MAMKHRIEVRDKNHKVITTIERVLRSESIGNFNPVFCTYENQKCLVRSDSGDLSDPFRREPEYLNHLFIEV